MKLKRHPSTIADRFTSLVDLTCDDGTLIETMHIDCLTDLGLDEESKQDIDAGQVVTVDLVRREDDE